MWVFFSLLVTVRVGGSETGKYLGPCSMAPSQDGRMLYIAFADARQIGFFNIRSGKVARLIAVPAKPSSLTLSPDGRELYVTCAATQSRALGVVSVQAVSQIRQGP